MPRAVFVLSLLLSFGIPSIANGNEHCREFVLFTQPKTGTYLLSPFLQKLSYRRQHFATMCDFSKYPRPAFSEEEFEDCLDREGYVPVFMHHLTIPNEDYLINLERLATSAEYFACHTPYSRQLDKLLDERNCVVFFIKRDPRDVIISGARYYGTTDICPFPRQWYHSLSFKEQIMVMITGSSWHNSARWILSAFKGWVYSPNCCVICFEELTQNPGSPEQYAQFAMIRTALNLELSLDEMLEVYFSVFGQGPTYSGKIGNWREVFTNEHKQACKAHIGDLLIELGYETGYDW